MLQDLSYQHLSIKCDIVFAVKEENLAGLQQQPCLKVLLANDGLGAAMLDLRWFIQPSVLPSLVAGAWDSKGSVRCSAPGGMSLQEKCF